MPRGLPLLFAAGLLPGTVATADSPLLRERKHFAGGCALTWILGESARRVPRDD